MFLSCLNDATEKEETSENFQGSLQQGDRQHLTKCLGDKLHDS